MVDPHDDAERTATPGDPGADAPPTETELREARELAAALERGGAPNDDAAFLRTLVVAHAPESFTLSPEVNERLVSRVLSKKREAAPRNGRLIRIFFGAGAVALAAAAAIALVLGKPTETDGAKLAQSRSTQELFREPFHGDQASARIDRIAMARAGDLRENRFARWGVR